MQQATSSIDNLVSTAGTSLSPKAANPPRFVVNLCASTTPVGLVQPTHAGLKRFTFFVSRRLEEGRERFRLHMGYFDSQEEAEHMLDLVRDVYPAAWAGVAPGIKLRARAALPEPVAPAPPVAAVAAPVPVAAPPVAAVAAPAPAAPTVAPSAPPLKLELAPDLPRAPLAVVAKKETPAGDATSSLTNLRATIASLGDASEAAAAPAAAPAEAVLEGEAVLRLLTSARPAPAARIAPVRPAAKRPAPVAPPAVVPAAAKPKSAPPPEAAQPEPALFAVQLLWSVQPIDMAQVAQLAIFSAYTLYGAEGNRDGRRWYGLRLGFFTDAVSAKQVAQYVRSEFNSVSVVPVSERERARAGAATAKPLPAPAPQKSNAPELNFIDEVATDTATSGSRPAIETAAKPAAKPTSTVSAAAIAAVGMTSRATPGKRAKLRTNGPNGRPGGKRSSNRQLSLEETLEILGAGDLQMEQGRGELLNDSAQQDRKTPTPSGSRFSRLINRLAERLGNT
jgi:hypothetical protein